MRKEENERPRSREAEKLRKEKNYIRRLEFSVGTPHIIETALQDF